MINGNLKLDGNDTLVMEINGTTPGNGATNYDQFVVNGTVDLGGAAPSASTTNAFTPTISPNQSFVLIDNDLSDAVTNTFNGLPEGSVVLINGVQTYITYQGNSGNDVELDTQPHIHGTAADDKLNIVMQAGGGFTYQLNGGAIITVPAGVNTLSFDADGGSDKMFYHRHRGENQYRGLYS